MEVLEIAAKLPAWAGEGVTRDSLSQWEASESGPQIVALLQSGIYLAV